MTGSAIYGWLVEIVILTHSDNSLRPRAASWMMS